MNAQLEIIPPDQVKDIEQDTSYALTQSRSLAILDEPTLIKATDILSVIKSVLNKCEERRKFFVKPLNDHVSRINLFFKNFTQPLETEESNLKTKVIQYRQIVEAKRLEEEKRIQKEHAKLSKKLEARGEDPLPVPILAPQKQTIFSDSGALTAKKIWTFDVLNLDRVPRQYLILDDKKINAVIRGGVREIPGLKIYQKETIAVKA